MFATMNPELRTRILATYPEEHAAGVKELSQALLLFDPSRFGVRAYLHFTGHTNNREFLQAVFDGKALSD